jgi:hypothetical protein
MDVRWVAFVAAGEQPEEEQGYEDGSDHDYSTTIEGGSVST